jgi:hypothetical protein
LAITARANPTAIKWSHFKEKTELKDPNDGKPVDAVTRFGFDFPGGRPREVDGSWALADLQVITITPICLIKQGAGQTDDLLSHEQLHYDVGIVTARALARKLTKIRVSKLAELRPAVMAAVDLHIFKRAALLQQRYDRDTKHGVNRRQQRLWKNQMGAVLEKPGSEKLHGYWL